MSTAKYYVYQYLDENGQPYYVGKGSGARIREKHTCTVVPPIERRVVIESGLTNEQAKEIERQLIMKYGRKIDGGVLDNIKVNQWACFAGWEHSGEARQKISKANTGKVRTEEHKKNYSLAKQNMTEENKANIQRAVKNLWADPEYKAKRMEKVIQTRIKNGFSR